MESDNEILQSLIDNGSIGEALSALILAKNEEDSLLGTIAGAAILATFKANKMAMATNIPMFIEESGNLYYIQPGEQKKFIRKLEKPTIKLHRSFKLK